jgi:hypothetical protein
MTLRQKQDTATLKRTGGEELDKKGGKKKKHLIWKEP